MEKKEAKKIITEVSLLTASTLLFLYFYSKAGLDFNYAFDLSKTQNLMNIEIIKNLIISLFFISFTIFLINYFAKGIVKKERAISITLSAIISLAIWLFYFNFSKIALSMFIFYWLALLFISLKTHKKPKNAWEKIGIGWSHAKNIVLILAIGSFITSMYFTNLNLEEYQSTIKNSMINVALTASQQFMPEGTNQSLIGNSKNLFSDLIEQMPAFKSFLSALPLLTGLMIGSIVLFIGNITIPPITAFLCLFLKIEKKPVIKLRQKKGLFDSVPLENQEEKEIRDN